MHTEIMLNPAYHLLKLEYNKLRNELTSALKIFELNHYSDDLELHNSGNVIFTKHGML